MFTEVPIVKPKMLMVIKPAGGPEVGETATLPKLTPNGLPSPVTKS